MVAGKSTGRATRGAAHQRQPSGRLANRVPGSGVGAWGAAGVVESLFDTWRRHAARAVGGNNPTTTVSFLEVQRPIRHVRGGNTVVTTKMELLELLSKAEGTDVDFLREGVRVLAQALMDVEVAAQIGAEYGQRAPDRRVAQRNGYRPREWDTRAGTVELAIPKLRQGSYFPSILEPRRRAERALASVVAQCYVEGVSTRRVDDIARSMGLDGISKSQVSRVCGELDGLVAAWRNRPLDAGPYPFVWLDALSVKVREGGRVVNTAALVATAVNADGHRELLGLELGSAETGASWTAFLRGLLARGLAGVRLVVSDAHQGLKEAIAAVLDGATW